MKSSEYGKKISYKPPQPTSSTDNPFKGAGVLIAFFDTTPSLIKPSRINGTLNLFIECKPLVGPYSFHHSEANFSKFSISRLSTVVDVAAYSLLKTCFY